MKAAALALVFCSLLAACSSSQQGPATALSSTGLTQPTGWRAVLVAGDDAEPAFDNAVDAMARKLQGFGVPHASVTVLKANGLGDQEATKLNIVAAFARLAPEPSQGCFVFATSHGAPGKGLFMKRAQAFLTPNALDELLAESCSGHPTVIIASGCFSGSFAEGAAMPAANRVILTAARDDRPSFGCNAEREYTVFDQCVLENLEGGSRWQDVMDKARACVEANERAISLEPASQPQLSIGSDVAGLRVFAR